MNSPLQLTISKDNLHSAITTFLYSIKAIPANLNVTDIHIHRKDEDTNGYELTIYNEEEEVEIRYF